MRINNAMMPTVQPSAIPTTRLSIGADGFRSLSAGGGVVSLRISKSVGAISPVASASVRVKGAASASWMPEKVIS